MKHVNVAEMVRRFLKMNGFGGLVNPAGSGCACGIDGSGSGGCINDACLGAYKTETPEGKECYVLEKPEGKILPVRCIYCRHCEEDDYAAGFWRCVERDVDGIDPWMDEPCCLYEWNGRGA